MSKQEFPMPMPLARSARPFGSAVPNHYSGRRGFTLVELLVVMLIIAILIGLLIPAVNAARNMARATQSRNNLRQMGLATHGYAASQGHFPPSYYSGEYVEGNPLSNAKQNFPGYANLEGFSVHVLLLPHLEQKLLFDNLNLALPYNHYINDGASNPSGGAAPTVTLGDGSVVKLGTMRVPTYVSPGEKRDEIREGKHHPINYAMNIGTWFVWDPLTGKGGNGAGYPNSKLRDDAFTDGMSTTLAFAEVKAWNPYFRDSGRTHAECGGSSTSPETATPPASVAALGSLMGTPNEYKATAHTEWFNGHAHHAGFTTVFPPNFKVMCGNASGSSATVNASGTGNLDVDWTNKQEGKNHFAGTPDTSPTYAAITARGYFEGGVNVAMMDGSVRNVENGINVGVWRSISTRNGAELLPNSFGK
jgi:prepilin-type N-terminal cleavage/methylation domain-containing protein/prepilin-type processing-associated H-X9-DG protein